MLLAAFFIAPPAHGASLRVVQTITLPNVEGRIDHMTADVQGQRLFVAALGNGSVEVVDLKSGKVVQSITALAEPQGVLFHPKTGRLFVATAGDGRLAIYEGSPLKHLRDLTFTGDADNLRYDPSAKIIYLGYGNGAIAAINPETLGLGPEIKLPVHPESFQLEPSGDRVFVNIPEAKQISALNRLNQKILATWPQKWSANFPMALDPSSKRILVAFRSPAKLAVLDWDSGEETQVLDLCGDCDDLFYDGHRHKLYAACGEGKIEIFNLPANGKVSLSGSISTAKGARTALFVPELGRLYLAVPHRDGQRSEIRVYQTTP
jgi:DNA-binding beta-propeller fold protein YncE